MKGNVEVFADGWEAGAACAGAIAGWLKDAIRSRGMGTLAISGGWTPRLMLGELARLEVEWDKVHVFWVDERCVPPDDEQSNYRLAWEALIEPARIPERNVHRVWGERDPVEAALAYAEEVEKFFGLERGELPVFDVVECGIGADGHTASLFPGEPLVMDRQGIAVSLWVEKHKQWRITLLPGVFLGARHVCVLAAGMEKAEAVEAALEPPEDLLRVPAQLLRYAKWFVDEAAASRLAEPG